MKKGRNRNSFVFVLLFISYTIIFITKWVNDKFGEISFEQLLFHIKVSNEGVNIEPFFEFFKSYAWFVVFYSLIIFILFKKILKKQPYLSVKIFKYNYYFNIFPISISKISMTIFSVSMFIMSLLFMSIKLNINEYIINQSKTSTIYEDYYVNPNSVNITFDGEKRNLIYIIMESMETSYASYQTKDKEVINLIPSLKSIAIDNISFSNNNEFGGALSAPLTGWTVAGIVAQTSGVPLNIPIEGNSYGEKSSFLPGIVTIGDILNNEGYNQVFMMGSDGNFAGRKTYLTQHGNYTVWDYNTAIKKGKIDKDYLEFWGFEDKKLFEYAKEEILKLDSKGKPFNFSMLTVDTHFYDGYVDDECDLKYDSSYANAISCSDKKIGEFVSWIKKQDFYKNTTIVLVGDHLTMTNEFFSHLKDDSSRYIYNAYINSVVKPINKYNRQFSVMDIFPTTIASIGGKIEGNKLGLGVNLFSDEKTLIEINSTDNFFKELNKKSKYYNEKFIYNN